MSNRSNKSNKHRKGRVRKRAPQVADEESSSLNGVQEESTADEDVTEDTGGKEEDTSADAEDNAAEDTEKAEKTDSTEDSGEEKAKAAKVKKPADQHKKNPHRKNRQSPPKRNAPPRDEAAIARKSIKHIRTGGVPDEEMPRRRRNPVKEDVPENEVLKKRRHRTPSTEEIREARQREKNKRRIRTIAILSVVAVFAGLAYFTRAHWVPQLESVLERPKETIVNDGEVKKGNFPLSFDEGSVSSIGCSGSYLLCLDKNQIRFYDEEGNEENSFSHNYADPVMRSTDNRVLLYDKGGSSLMVLGRKNEVFSKVVKNKLIMAELAENNNVAVVTSDKKYAGILTIYDGNGRELYTWSSSSALLSVTFDKSGNGCFVTTYASKGGKLGSVVRYITFDKKDPEMESKTLPVLALKALQNDNGDFWVVGDTAFYRLDDNGKVITEYSYQGRLKDFDVDRSCAAVVLDGVQRRSSVLMIFDSNSTKESPDYIAENNDGAPERLKIKDGKTVLLKENSIDCYDRFGNLTATAECSSNYNDFVYLEDNVYFRDYREVNKISFST